MVRAGSDGRGPRLSRQSDAQYLWYGVSVESDASSPSELNMMLDVIEALTPSQRRPIKRMCCSSDAYHCFIEISRWDEDVAQRVLRTSAEILFTHEAGVRSLTIVPVKRA